MCASIAYYNFYYTLLYYIIIIRIEYSRAHYTKNVRRSGAVTRKSVFVLLIEILSSESTEVRN